MSWIFGYFGNTDRQKLTSPELPHFSFSDSNLIVFAGGNKQTCFFKSASPNSCVIVCGVGLQTSGNGYKVLDENVWLNLLNSNQNNFKSTNGHFATLRYTDNELHFFTDELGLRDIYIVKLNGGFGFTTRVDWIKYFINPEIDLKEFGSRWFLQNQISQKSIIKNAIRLVCANASIRNNSLKIENNHWQPDLNKISNPEQFDLALKKLLTLHDKKISLSLSGGLDSRLLLSYLSKMKTDRWETHTFGDSNHPDSKIATELLKALELKNDIINDSLPAKDELVNLTKSYSIQSLVTNPASSILNLRFYDKLSNENRVIVDGGFGEIWRRSFANKILIAGKYALWKKDIQIIADLLRYTRADIFSVEANNEMKTGIVKQLDSLFSEIPDANQISTSKWVDLFSISSRLTNYYAPEQTRIDQFAVSFMPLVQKDVLSLLFGLDESVKINGSLFKKLIRENLAKFTNYPLVKGNITHPFNSSSIGARIHSVIKNKLKLSYQSNHLNEYMNSLKEFVGDITHSASFKNYKDYDRTKIKKITQKFLSGDVKYNSEIDWLLSFELFRQGILE